MDSLKKMIQIGSSKSEPASKAAAKPSTESKVGKNIEVVASTLNILHYIVKFLPLGFYFFAYFSSTIYKDIKSALLLIGLIINDIIGYLWKKYTRGTNNPNCNIGSSVGEKMSGGSSEKTENNFYGDFFQNPHVEIVSFVTSFFGSDMFFKKKLDIIPFVFLSVTLFLTIWSMMSIKCETSISDVITNMIFGALRGCVYYFIIKNYYMEAEKGKLEKEACDLGFDNYRCDEIRNGTIITKENSKSRDEEGEEEAQDEDF